MSQLWVLVVSVAPPCNVNTFYTSFSLGIAANVWTTSPHVFVYIFILYVWFEYVAVNVKMYANTFVYLFCHLQKRLSGLIKHSISIFICSCCRTVCMHVFSVKMLKMAFKWRMLVYDVFFFLIFKYIYTQTSNEWI